MYIYNNKFIFLLSIVVILFNTKVYSNDFISSIKEECNKGNGQTCFMIAKALDEKIKNNKENRNFSEAIKYYEKSCNYKFGEACFNLAHKYISGEGVTKDISFGFKLYQKAFDLSYPLGYLELGRHYSNGKIVEKDLKKAKYYYQESCHAGAKQACGMDKYVDKIFTKEEDYKSLENAKKICDTKTSGIALLMCGSAGNIYKKYNDFENAIIYYKKACNVLSSECIPLSEIYVNKKFNGYDAKKAISYLEKGCENGNIESCIKIGEIYKNLMNNVGQSRVYFNKVCSLGYLDYCN